MTAPSKARQLADSGIYLVPVVIGNLIPIVTLPIFTRILTPHDYGMWALATAYAAFVTGLANFGLTICYDRNFFQYREGTQPGELLYSVLAFVASAYVVCAIGTWVLRHRIAQWLIGDAAAGDLVFWTTCATGLASLKVYYLTYLRNTGQAKAYVWFTIDETLLTTVFSLTLIAGLRVGVTGLPWGQLAAAAIVFGLVTRRFLGTVPLAFSRRLLASSLKLSYPLTPRIFLGVVGSNFDKYLVGLLASVGNTGVYAIGQKVSYLVFAFMTALENVFAPQVYQRMFGMGADGGRSIGRYLTPFAYVSVAMAVAVSLFSEEAITLLTPPAYHGAIPVVNLLTIYYAIMFFGKQPQLVYAKKTYLLSVLTFVTLGSNVLLNIVCIRAFGTVGAALGTLLSGCLSVGLYNVVATRYYRIEWQFGRLGVIYATLLACALVTVWLRYAGVEYWIRLAFKIALCGVYGAIGVRLSVLTRENFDIVRRLVLNKLRPAAAAGSI